MALTSTEEAQLRDLIAQQAALLSLASSESTIISKLGATKATLSSLSSASSLGDTDLFLVRQGTTDKNSAWSLVKSALASIFQPVGNYLSSTANTWVRDSNNAMRLFFDPAGSTIVRGSGPVPIILYRADGSELAYFWENGGLVLGSDATAPAGVPRWGQVQGAIAAGGGMGSSEQTFQDMTASRNITGGSYTNSTGKTILCVVTISMTTSDPDGVGVYRILQGGVEVARSSIGDTNGSAAGVEHKILTFPVVNGATYKIEYVSGEPSTLTKWMELRA